MAKKFLSTLKIVNLPSDPVSGSEGELYFNTSASVAKIYQAGSWSVLGAGGGGGGTTVSTTEPESPEIGDSWYKNDTGEFYVYDGTYWVEVNGVIEYTLSQEEIQDYVAPLFTHGNHTNASVTYDDALNELHIDVTSAPTAGFTSVLKHDVKLNGSIAKGQAVYVSSANGTNIIVSKASNTSEATSSKTLGLLETGGSNNAIVKVVTEGLLAGLNTSTATAGDPVWLGTDGNLIYGLVNKPFAPAHLVFIGIVTRVNSSNGEIFVKVQNGFELNEIHDIGIGYSASIQNNEVLAYDSSSSIWINKTANEAGIATTEDLSGFLTEESASTTYITQIEANESFQPLATVLSNISDLELSAGFLVSDGINDWYIDENEYLTTTNASSTYLSQTDAAITYLAQTTAASAYQPIGEYLIGEDLNGYLTESSASVIYQPVGDYLIPADLSGYLTESSASITYQPLDEDLTQISLLNSSTATAGLLATNGSGYWTIDTTAYLTTESDPVFTASDAYGIDSTDISNWNEAHGWGNHADAGYSLTSHNHTLDSLSNVVITGAPSDGQAIVWDTTTSKWVNETVSGGGASYPDQTGNNGKFLQTNGASVSWQNVDFTGYLTEASASSTYLTQASASSTYQLIGSYLTSESDTLETVTDRGATSSNAISITNATAASSTSTGALIVTGGVGIGEDLYVNNDVYIGGDINITGAISGSLSFINVTDLVVTDPLIYLADSNPNDMFDIGIFGAYNHSSSVQYHTGLIRDASDSGKWKLASNLLDPTSNVIDYTGAIFDTLKIGALEVTDASTTRTNLGLAIGTDIQAYNSTLAAVAGGTYTGDDSITTVGTISSGTWNGTTIGYPYGGTGLTTLGTAGQVLKVNSGATGLEWGTVDALPSQSGNNGKYLTTDGSTASWGTLNLSLYLTQSSASSTYATIVSPTLTTPNIGAATGTSLTTTGNVVSHIDILTPTFTTNAYTLIAGDDGDLLMLNNSSSSGSLYVPTDASVNFTIGTQITMVQSGTGQITVLATTPGTTTVNSTPGSKLRAQWSSATLVKTAANTWILMGDLSV